MKYLYLFPLLFPLIYSCSNTPLERALVCAGVNRSELETVIEYYSQQEQDSLKLRAALFLIENMPGHYSYGGSEIEDYYEKAIPVLDSSMPAMQKKDSLESISLLFPDLQDNTVEDIEIITAEFLIENIEKAFELWDAPWAKHLDFEHFCEYLLPYKCVELQHLDNWRDTLAKRCGKDVHEIPFNDETSNLTLHVARLANTAMRKSIKFYSLWGKKSFSGYPFLSAATMDKIPFGFCDDYNPLGTAALRSLGIAAFTEYIPLWGRGDTGHSWYGFINNNGVNLISDYDFTSNFKSDCFPNRNIPKIYRYTYSSPARVGQYFDQAEHIHPSINRFTRDVTDQYLATSDFSVSIHKNRKRPRYAHICLFNGSEWEVVDFGVIRGSKAHFEKMGRNILYVAMEYDGKKLIPISDPFIVYSNGQVKLLPGDIENSTEIKLTRKYPTTLHLVRMHRRLIGGKIQACTTADFESPVTLIVIESEDIPDLLPLPDSGKYRYWRYLPPAGAYGNIAELQFYKAGEQQNESGEIIGAAGRKNYEPEKAFDGDWLTFYDSWEPEPWVGMDFGDTIRIDRVRIIPRTDDNGIHFGDTYELKYWSRSEWCSLGTQTAVNNFLKYEQVPAEALFWLSNITRGKQERIFTYENNRQIFW